MTPPHMLYLMRHGAPMVPGRLLGRTDDPVTKAGVARCIAQARDIDVEQILSSDLARARDCAEAIARPREIEVQIDPRWRELDFGTWDGLAAADIDPVALAAFYDDPDFAAPPEGERWSDLVTRVAAALAAVAPFPTLVLTHGGAIRAALAVACGFGLRQTWAFDLPYSACLALKIWSGDAPTVQIVGLST